MAPRAKRAAFATQLALQNVKSFQGAHTLDLTDDGRPARWTLILGENGVGKTTLLECLAHLAPVFNSNDQGSEDPEMFVEPRVAAAAIARLLKLPTERNPENEEAMTIVREAATLLKAKVRRD